MKQLLKRLAYKVLALNERTAFVATNAFLSIPLVAPIHKLNHNFRLRTL